MKIELTKKELNSLINLLQIREINIDIATMYLYYLNQENNSINEKLINKYDKKYHDIEKDFYYAFLEVMEVEEDDDLLYADKVCSFKKNMKLLNPDKYINNPYYQNIHVKPMTLGKWKFQYDQFSPYQGFLYQDFTFGPNYSEITHFGFFNQPFSYLTISQNNEIWMSITPHEIETMEDSLNECFGNIVVLGLGLGYYPYMASLKDNVTHITIIEKDENVIKLFEDLILPQFPHPEKITIIAQDGFAYMEKNAALYDYAFIDLWHNVDDGITMYLKMKQIENKINSKTIYSYWIENSFIAYLRRNLLTLIDEQADHSQEENYLHEENYDDHLINQFYFALKDQRITSLEQIKNLLSKESIISLINKIKI
jgi:hypothetical protein